MEISVRVNVKADEFYKALIHGVVADINRTTGKKIRVSHILKGYTYTKSYRHGDAKIRIYDLSENKEYHSEYVYGEMKITMDYLLEEDGEDTVVHYKEEMSGKKESMMNKISSLRAQSKTKKLIAAIAKAALEARNTKEEESEENE